MRATPTRHSLGGVERDVVTGEPEQVVQDDEEQFAAARQHQPVQVTVTGRNRCYSLAGPAVARAVEALQALAPPLPVRALRAARTGTALAFVRTCYDHLAGQLAIALAGALVDRDVIGPLQSGAVGELRQPHHELLHFLGVSAAAATSRRRPAVGGCLDCTQRVPHLAGGLGAQLLSGMTDRAASDR